MSDLHCRLCGIPLESDDVLDTCSSCCAVEIQGLVLQSPEGDRPSELKGGVRVGDYTILSEIARGGMGIVYLARHDEQERAVALKLIHRHLLDSVRTEARFRTEIEIGASLQHPNIIPVLEVGEFENSPFYTMPYLQGGNLSGLESLANSPSTGNSPNQAKDSTAIPKLHSLRERVGLVIKVARAVQFAHERGVLHRDLKPSNILLDESSEPYVVDFGLSKRCETASDLTLTGEIIGTPSYMSPEQISTTAGKQTISVDIYSLGAVLYFLVTGVPPFQGSSPLEVIRRVESEEVPFSPDTWRKAGADLETITRRCLEKEPSARYRSVRDLVEDLERWLDGRLILARPYSVEERVRKWVRRKPILATLVGTSALFLAIMAGTVYSGYQRSIHETERTRLANDQLSLALETSRTQSADTYLRVGDIGRALAHLALNLRERPGRSGSLPLVKSVVDRYAPAYPISPPLRHTRQVAGIAFHPDGKRLATACYDSYARIFDMATGELTVPPLAHQEGVYRVAFRPEKNEILTGGFDGVARVWNTQTGDPLSPKLMHGDVVLVAKYLTLGDQFITSGTDDVVKLWDANHPVTPIREFPHPSADYAIHIVEVIPGTRQFISASVTGSMYLWDLDTGKMIRELNDDAGYLSQLIFSEPAQAFLALSPTRSSLWDSTRVARTRWLELSGDIWSAVFGRNGDYLAVLGQAEINYLNLETGSSKSSPAGLFDGTGYGHRIGSSNAFAFYHNDTVMTSSCDALRIAYPAVVNESLVTSIESDPNRNRIAIVAHEQDARVWEWPRQGVEEPVFQVSDDDSSNIIAFGIGESGQPIAFLMQHWTTELVGIDFLGGNEVVFAHQREAAIRGYRVWPEQQKIAILSNELEIHDLETGPVATIEAVPSIRCLAVSPDGTWFVGGTHDLEGLFRVNLLTGEYLGNGEELAGPVLECVFTENGKHLVAGLTHGGLAVWSTGDWSEIERIEQPWGKTSALAANPVRSQVVLASQDSGLRVLSVEPEVKLLWERKLSAYAGKLVFEPKGRFFATGSIDGSIEVWDAKSGDRIGATMKHSGVISQLAIHPNGRVLLAVSADHTYRFWSLPDGTAITEALEQFEPTTKVQKSHEMEIEIQFSPSGDYYSLIGEDGTIEIRRTPSAPETIRAPDWFPEFIEAYGGVRLQVGKQLQVLEWEERKAVFERVLNSGEDDELAIWARQTLTERLPPDDK